MLCYTVQPNGEIDDFISTKVCFPGRIPPAVRVRVVDLFGEEQLLGPLIFLERQDRWSYDGTGKVKMSAIHAPSTAMVLFLHQPPATKTAPAPIIGMEDAMLLDEATSRYNDNRLAEIFVFSQLTTLKQGEFLWSISKGNQLQRTCL